MAIERDDGKLAVQVDEMNGDVTVWSIDTKTILTKDEFEHFYAQVDHVRERLGIKQSMYEKDQMYGL